MLAIKGSQGMWNIPPDPEFCFQFFPLIWSSRTSEVLSGELILDVQTSGRNLEMVDLPTLN